MRLTLAAVFLLLTSALASGCQGTAPAGTEATLARVIILEHTKAEDMAATLNEFLADMPATKGNSQLLVEHHDGHNALLVRGTAERVDQVLNLIARLDVESEG